MSRNIRWGMIGCGAVAEVKSGPALRKASGSEVVAVMRRDAAKAEDYARRHGIPRWYADVDALLADPEVDAVYVGTPPGSHMELALRVCAANKPLYVEKPMARSATECVLMRDAFSAAELPLFVAYYRRALPRFVEVKRALDAGEIGAVRSVSYRYTRPWQPTTGELPWRFRAEEAGGGLFMDLGCHTLDLFDFLFGPLEGVSGTASNVGGHYDVEDTIAMTFRTASGASGSASWSFVTSPRADEIEIRGAHGVLRCTCFGDEPIVVERGDVREERARPNPPHIQQPLVQTIVDELRGRGRAPSTGESALRTARVMDAVLATYWGDRGGAFWEATPRRRP